MSGFLAWLLGNWQPLLGALGGLLGCVVALLLIIPGNQGESFIQKIADFFKMVAGKGIK